ncbi:MAG TPA: hypothetical protein DEP35_12125 [Deltaproteobacteria bacterium]|nr:hypothetical protein [Deltaproteobacteria bacterium]
MEAARIPIVAARGAAFGVAVAAYARADQKRSGPLRGGRHPGVHLPETKVLAPLTQERIGATQIFFARTESPSEG